MIAARGGMFDQMPDDFPPKKMLGGIEEIRANIARTLELLEVRTGARARAGSGRRILDQDERRGGGARLRRACGMVSDTEEVQGGPRICRSPG